MDLLQSWWPTERVLEGLKLRAGMNSASCFLYHQNTHFCSCSVPTSFFSFFFCCSSSLPFSPASQSFASKHFSWLSFPSWSLSLYQGIKDLRKVIKTRMIFPSNATSSNTTYNATGITGEQSSDGHLEEVGAATSIRTTPTASIMIQQRVSSSSSSGVLTAGSSIGRYSCPSTRSHSLSSSPAMGVIAPSSLGVIHGSSLTGHGSGSLTAILSTSPSYDCNAGYSDYQDYDDQYYDPPKCNLYHSTNDQQMMVSMDGYYFTNKPVNPVSSMLYLETLRWKLYNLTISCSPSQLDSILRNFVYSLSLQELIQSFNSILLHSCLPWKMMFKLNPRSIVFPWKQELHGWFNYVNWFQLNMSRSFF